MKGLTLTIKEQTRLSIMNGVLQREWTIPEAAELLGVSERHTWRLLSAYRMEGAAALAHGNRGRLPTNATPGQIQTQVIALARERYRGLNYSHLTELLAEREGITLSRSTVRRLLKGAGLTSPRRREDSCHRYRRPRMPQEGMLVQIDGSHHRWLEERGPYFTLLLAVDDATGTVPYALFREQEDTEGYFLLLKGIIQRRGIPMALYSDRYFVFCYSKSASEPGCPSVIDRSKPTQFGRAMLELGITQVFARSPQAKGRVERANGTFQDRLVAELRLANASTIDEANSILEGFLPRFNERFGVPAAQPETAYRPLDPALDMDAVLCFKELRRVAKDNTVQYHGQILQIFPGIDRRSFSKTRVEVQKRLDGKLLIYYHSKILAPENAPPLASYLRAKANNKNEFPMTASVSEDVFTDPKTTLTKPGVIWYEDSEMRLVHRQLVKDGMKRARDLGKRIGRPRVIDRPDFPQRFAAIVERIDLGLLSRRQAANELVIGYATLKRLLDARHSIMDMSVNRSTATTENHCIDYAEVIN